MSLASLIKRLQDIMRKDSGVDGDAQRLAQIVWLIFLKVYDYKEEEAELDDDYVPVIPKGYRWRDWAVGTSVKEQMTGPDLLDFVNNKLIPALGGNPITVDVPIDENGNEITDKAKMKFAKGFDTLPRLKSWECVKTQCEQPENNKEKGGAKAMERVEGGYLIHAKNLNGEEVTHFRPDVTEEEKAIMKDKKAKD